MKTKMSLLIAVVGVLTFSSCKKCYTCQNKNSIYTEEICKPDNMNQKGWKDYVKSYEDYNNAKCK